ncbi:FAD-dependent oxidoreductase [Streptomyces cocklensis]|uniref:Thioredoxin reductase n=1 Tax=Actinacidiphila cocklensis TaxID=887465 RepID=A0A9W4DRF0_9ACTN|nr:FAD-dependent oxidoreductase [Actinacidiphila cocklensis]MDD1062937.1 FAD-dependent oxidoreductase [Actinacidiphila cocklensis]CAG6394875.1 Thioredoxin reductase [Actinacidiphila cocklensis]
MTATTDLVIVGGGPAGCAAAVMAASVGMRSVLIEPDALCAKLKHIAAVNNVVGGHTRGPELAAAIAGDVARAELCEVELGVRVTGLRAYEDHVVVTTDNGRTVSARYAVVATGVGPVPVSAAPWLTVATGADLPTLWGAKAADAAAGSVLVLGADRPLGTFLRAHPSLDATVVVAYPPEDDYKVDEVRGDARVMLLPVADLSVVEGGDSAFMAEWVDREGRSGSRTVDAVFANLGSAPVVPPGDLVADTSGYCPPDRQHSRILVAGDLRSARFERIMAATGSGSEAALRAYYDLRGI